MSWFCNDSTSWMERLCINILKAGHIPNHIAFIMDGNRRFAKKNKLHNSDGHLHGFEKMAKTLLWCRNFGVTEITVYAFSIENFKRPKEEVDDVMELAREKFKKLLKDKHKIMEQGLCLRFLGDLSLLPEDIQNMVAEIVELSKDNRTAILNICLAYTSRNEITTVVKEVAEGVEKGLLLPSDVDDTLIEKSLYTNKSKSPDLVIRTSGEVRLSDFLLWQNSYSVLQFVHVLWPEFTFWHLAFSIFYYQRQVTTVKKFEDKYLRSRLNLERVKDYKCAVEEFMKRASSTEDQSFDLQDAVAEWTKCRENRVNNFLLNLEEKRDNMFKDKLLRK